MLLKKIYLYVKKLYQIAKKILWFLGAAGSTTAEVGVAFGANAEVLVYASYCVGLKADVSLEVDLSLGFYKSLDDILGHYYMLGGGVDITKKKTDETEANVKIIKVRIL